MIKYLSGGHCGDSSAYSQVFNEKRMQLYTRAASSCSFRIRIALGVKKLPWEAVLVDVAMQQSAKYRDLNPQALVPFLIDGKAKIGQTLAILEYLGEV